MSTIYIIFNNELENSVGLTASSFLPNFPAENIKSGFRSKTYRSMPLANLYGGQISISGTFLTATAPISGMSIINHNIMPGVTYTLDLYSNSNQTNLVWSSGAITVPDTIGLDGWGYFPWGSDSATHPPTPPIELFTQVHSAYSFKLTFGNLNYMQSQTLPYLYIGSIVMGTFISPTIGFSKGGTLGYEESTDFKRTVAGGIWTSAARLPYKTLSLSFPVLTEADKTIILNYSRFVGKRRSFYVSAYQTESGIKKMEYAMFCRMSKLPKFTEIAPGYFSMDLDIEEA